MSSDHEDDGTIVKMRGLPWSATVEEIFKFFDGCNIRGGKSGVQMTMSREGRPSGEAYVEMETEDDVQKALKKDRDHMGPRYIEVFRAKRSEMEWVLRRSGMTYDNAIDEGCVRLRGLPFGCTKDEISDFFKGLEIVSNGIILPTDYTGRSTGEAYVEFVNKDMAEKALQKHKEKIGHRYIEIFRSSRAEVRSMSLRSRPMGGGGGGGGGGFNQRPTPYDRGDRFGGLNRYNTNNNMGPLSRPSRNFKSSYSGGFGDFDDGPWEPSPWNNNRDIRDMRDMRGNGPSRGGNMMSSRNNMSGNMNSFNDNGGGPWNDGPMHVIHMRGLPFRATQGDIADFFRPINPVNIRLLCDDNGRPSGEADVEFISHEDAVRAMSKDKGNMQHRYIELFLNSSAMGSGGGGGGSGGFGNSSYNGGGGGGGGYGGRGGGRWGDSGGRGYM